MRAIRNKKGKKLIHLDKLIDPWSVPHFLSGIVAALAVIVFSWPVMVSFFVTFVLAMLWELLEKYFRLSEAPGNAWVDVLLPLIAFTLIFILLGIARIGQEQSRALFFVSVIVYIFVNFFAWRARLEHDRDFQG